MNNSILVSVIIPCYNQAQYLDETLQSVLNQTYKNWECLIINDGSLDYTEEIAKKWAEKDARFVYLKKDNGGLSSARNLGLKNAKGNYIQFLDSDDYISSTKFELSLKAFATSVDNNLKVVVSNFKMFTDDIKNTSAPYCNLNGELINFESLLYKWEESFTIPIHCGFFESSLFKGFQFPEHVKAKEDWLMWVALFRKNCKAVFIDEPLAFYRRNPDSMTMTKDLLPDFLKAYEYFRNFLTEDEFHQLSLVLISRFYKKSSYFIKKHNDIKNSNRYRTGNMIKKVLRRLHILNLAKSILRLIKT
jgi:glycosyltransferase involved in cell wall biosynthesis